jgi:hypothetical protein
VDGWTDLLTWSSNKPGGAWNKTVDVTAPADIDGPTYLISDTDTLTMLSQDPRLSVLVGGGNSVSAEAGNHFTAGNAFVVAGAARNAITRQYVTPDVSPAPAVVLMRLNTALGRGEYLRSSDLTWVAANGATADAFTMSASAGDSMVFVKTFTGAETAGWGNYDIAAKVVLYISGTPYIGHGTIEVLGAKNQHDVSRYFSVGNR